MSTVHLGAEHSNSLEAIRPTTFWKLESQKRKTIIQLQTNCDKIQLSQLNPSVFKKNPRPVMSVEPLSLVLSMHTISSGMIRNAVLFPLSIEPPLCILVRPVSRNSCCPLHLCFISLRESDNGNCFVPGKMQGKEFDPHKTNSTPSLQTQSGEHACGTGRQQDYQSPGSLAQEICSSTCPLLRQHRHNSPAAAANRVCQDFWLMFTACTWISSWHRK